VVPYGFQTGYWVVVNKTQAVAEAADKKMRADANSSSPPRIEAARTATVPDLRNFKLCPPDSCHQVPIWKLLLGLDRGYFNALLPIALILYNGCRAILTWRVSLLREEEERSGFSPAFASYRWLMAIHWVHRGLVIVAAGALIWHLVIWLRILIWVQP
jgi:hypothetical protein